MAVQFLPQISAAALKEKQASPDIDDLYELLVTPLHEELYKRQTFDFFDELTPGQQLLISYDYVRAQVEQGGFIQLIQNGYIGLLPSMPAWLQVVGAHEMAQLLDNVLKIYVQHRDILGKERTVEEFALLYNEFKELEQSDADFMRLNEPTVKLITGYAMHHPEEFAEVI
ncbi:MAG: hypothetical protein BGO69_06620 [Bacteroidetes bacterium 46-16]|nr:MAG: hypothetical protein BGO69_06620 [Bacteroidetes bacterium 46-16]